MELDSTNVGVIICIVGTLQPRFDSKLETKILVRKDLEHIVSDKGII